VFVHGGPGGGTSGKERRFFDPAVYRIVLFDQRGCGKSTPHADLRENTTWDLVADIERIREHLGIDKWLVFGGSWGSTLSLTYAIKHADRVTSLVLRGIFLLRKKELAWFYQEGASFVCPDAWEGYRDAIPEDERADFMAAYHKRLTSDDEETRLAVRRRRQAPRRRRRAAAAFLPACAGSPPLGAPPDPPAGAGSPSHRITSHPPPPHTASPHYPPHPQAARAWSIWEGKTSKLLPEDGFADKYAGDEFALAFARIENTYFVNGGWFESEQWHFDNLDAIRGKFPVVIVQGRYDMVCPMTTAWELQKALGDACEFHLIKDAGHSANEPGIQSALLDATDRYGKE